MMATEGFPAVERLYVDTVHVTATTRDWSEGYGETWDYIAAPECPECGTFARWLDGDDDLFTGQPGEDTWPAWRCPNGECENFGAELDPFETDGGPMMSYSYALPERDDFSETHAEKIADLPLCIVRDLVNDTYALALTGGGMDLSWEIAEAFMRLGFLPPLAYCDLPRMAGMDIDERRRWVLAGCLRSCDVAVTQATYAAERLRREYGPLS